MFAGPKLVWREHEHWAATHARSAQRRRSASTRRAPSRARRTPGPASASAAAGSSFPSRSSRVRELLERHRGHRTTHATLLANILDMLGGGCPEPEVQALREPLSDAELRVVRYLPSNLKATEIASELCVSPNTVRTHLRHIYAKLDAHTRSEAVTRARRLGLLAPAGLSAR